MLFPIPVSIVVVTKNEEGVIARCLEALDGFAEVWVVDSGSTDNTCAIAMQYGAKVVPYAWDGQYPKKRGWCLENLPFAHDWVFFVDADEVITPDLKAAIKAADLAHYGGFFIRGRYIWQGKPLRFGLMNTKLALFNRRSIGFPTVNDLGLPGMGEIEGHYQPTFLPNSMHTKIERLTPPLLHYACENKSAWEARHVRYAAWERAMNASAAWPCDPVPWRESIKRIFRSLPFRGIIAFAHSYIWRLGFLDGAAGLDFALARARYYRMIAN